MFVIAFLLILLSLYIHINNRTKFILQIEKYINPGETILDFGSGRCNIEKFFMNRNKVVNIDIYKGCKNTIVYDGKSLPFKDNQFDVVLCMFVLHHIPNQKQIIEELKRVCKNKLIIIEDNPQGEIQKFISSIHYLFFKQPPSYIKYMHTPDEWCDIIGKKCYIEQLDNTSLVNHFVLHT